MTRRPWVRVSAMLFGAGLLAAAGRLASDEDPGLEAHQLVEAMNTALLSGLADPLIKLFDPKMAAYHRVSGEITSLLKQSRAYSTITFVSNTGDAQARDLELDWKLQIRSDNDESRTERRARVKLRVEKQDANWRVTAITPADFFAPAQNGAIWDTIADSLGALTAITGDQNPAAGRVPTRFLAGFDRKMTGYDQLRANVIGLLAEGNVESSVALIRNEGDDRRRTVELEWTLSVTRPETTVAILRRQEHVTCQLERQKGKWLIVSLNPMSFLAPEKPK